MSFGRFIVFEGADGAGTTTQSKLLAKALGTALGGDKVLHTFEPSDGVIGQAIRKILSGTEGPLESVWDWREMSYLFMADRIHHVKTVIAPALKDGVHVICDRYYASTLVYQSIGENTSWSITKRMFELFDEVIKQPYFAEPGLWFYLSVMDPGVLQERRSSRNSRELYDDEEVQKKVIETYENWYGMTRGVRRTNFKGGVVQRVDGTLWKEDVFLRCLYTVLVTWFPEHLPELNTLVKSSLGYAN